MTELINSVTNKLYLWIRSKSTHIHFSSWYSSCRINL